MGEALNEVRAALDDTGRWPGDMACVGASALVPVLATYLRNESLVDASRHAPLYSGAMRLLSAVAAHVPACLVGAVDDDRADRHRRALPLRQGKAEPDRAVQNDAWRL